MRRKPTVADLRSLKGRRQLTMLRYFSLGRQRPPEIVMHPCDREVAPTVLRMTSLTLLEVATLEDHQRR